MRRKVEPVSPYGRFTALGDSKGKKCLACNKPLKDGDLPALVNSAPADVDEANRRDRGKAYTAKVGIAHEYCAYPNRPRRRMPA